MPYCASPSAPVACPFMNAIRERPCCRMQRLIRLAMKGHWIHYSYRSATMGSTRAARRAGTKRVNFVYLLHLSYIFTAKVLRDTERARLSRDPHHIARQYHSPGCSLSPHSASPTSAHSRHADPGSAPCASALPGFPRTGLCGNLDCITTSAPSHLRRLSSWL